MSRQFVIVLALFAILFACGEKEEKRPEHIWDEERMVEVLTAFQRTEAFVRLDYNTKADSSYVADSLFNETFNRLGTNRAEYDSNYSYYLNHPKALEKVYEKVIINLNEASGKLENEIKK